MNATITDSRLDEMMLGEVGCEAVHASGNGCTVEVTHHYRAECGVASKLVCSAAASYVEWARGNRYNVCDACSAPCVADWSVVPV